MRYFFILKWIVLPGMLIVLGCSSVTSSEPQLATVKQVMEKIFIVDQTGKEWDVTHAVNKYGMDPSKFQFGLGPNAIVPILDPQMLSPGDDGYPSDSETFLVLGVRLNGYTRAYPLLYMSCHEVAEEKFGETHVAVAY